MTTIKTEYQSVTVPNSVLSYCEASIFISSLIGWEKTAHDNWWKMSLGWLLCFGFCYFLSLENQLIFPQYFLVIDFRLLTHNVLNHPPVRWFQVPVWLFVFVLSRLFRVHEGGDVTCFANQLTLIFRICSRDTWTSRTQIRLHYIRGYIINLRLCAVLTEKCFWCPHCVCVSVRECALKVYRSYKIAFIIPIYYKM